MTHLPPSPLCQCSHPESVHRPEPEARRCMVADCDCARYEPCRRQRKYRNEPVTVGGQRYDSKAEARRGEELRLLERAGAIRDLRFHPRYRLECYGVHVCDYEADAEYWDVAAERLVVEDVKSEPTRTRLYAVKRKLMRACHGIEICEVEA